jgi:hypothetical protein
MTEQSTQIYYIKRLNLSHNHYVIKKRENICVRSNELCDEMFHYTNKLIRFKVSSTHPANNIDF